MRKKKYINIFYIPALIMFTIFVVIPFFEGLRISFTNWNGFMPGYKYVGFSNYIKFFTDPWIWPAFWNTITYGFGSTLFQNIIGLSMAMYLNRKFRGRGIMRTVAYLPVMIAPLIMGYVMRFVLGFRNGALNDVTGAFGMAPLDWLATPTRALIIITIVNTLQYMGVSMVIYLAGLKNIPAMYYEAAAIDGVSKWRQFRSVTLPLLMPAISSSVVINLIGGLKLFDIISALMPPSPSSGAHSLSTYLNFVYFNKQSAGFSAAIGVFTFLFILLVSIITMKIFDRKEVVM